MNYWVEKFQYVELFMPSIAEASRQTNIARKTIRQKVNDPKITDFFEI